MPRRFGASAVTIAFGEVVPALEKGVVDCGITGTMPAYKAKWPEVTNTLFRLPVGFTVGLWVVNLNMLEQAVARHARVPAEAVQGARGQVVEDDRSRDARRASPARPARAEPARVGPPGKLKLVLPSEADLKARDKALNDVVLKSWAKRCGDACAAKWNEIDRQEVRPDGQGQLTGDSGRARAAEHPGPDCRLS